MSQINIGSGHFFITSIFVASIHILFNNTTYLKKKPHFKKTRIFLGWQKGNAFGVGQETSILLQHKANPGL